MADPRDRPPLRVAELLRRLHVADVDWVLSGSAVLAVYGADLSPNDLDVVPALDAGNLERLAGLLTALDAVPAYVAGWAEGPSLAECRDWSAEPTDAANLDHLFVTRLGMLDVPPLITGSYEQLRPGATEVVLAEVPVWVCDPAEVLGRIPDRPRPKDHARAAVYEDFRRRWPDLQPLDLPRWRNPPGQFGPH